MNIAVRFYTKSGNTEKLAKAISEAVGVEAFPITEPLQEKADILFLGSSYYAFDMDPEVKSFIAENKNMIGKIAIFGTSAMMKSMRKPMSKAAEANNVILSDKEFHCRGEFKFANKGRPNADDLVEAAEFAKRVINDEP